MKNRRRFRPWSGIGGLLVGAGLGAVIGLVIRRAGGSGVLEVFQGFGRLDPLQWVLLIAGSVVAVLLVLATHEAGHLLGGRLVGFRFLLFIAGPVRVAREGDSVRLGLNRHPSLAGGIAATGPTTDRLDRLRRRTAVMVAGGPAASLLASAAGALWLAMGSGHAAVSGPAGVLQRLVMIFALASLAVAVVSLFPGRANGFLTDGARLLQLLRGGPQAEADAAGVALTAWSMAGVRPRDWDPVLVERMVVGATGPFHALAVHFAWLHALDAGDGPSAQSYRKALVGSLHEIPDPARPGVLLDLATDAALAWNPDEAELLLQQAGTGGALTASHALPLAEAAIAAVTGRPDDALAKADRVDALLDRAMDRSALAPARDRLKEVRAIAAATSRALS